MILFVVVYDTDDAYDPNDHGNDDGHGHDRNNPKVMVLVMVILHGQCFGIGHDCLHGNGHGLGLGHPTKSL